MELWAKDESRDKFSKERVQWYETMQKPLFDRRREVEEMRRLAKQSLEQVQTNDMKTLRATNGFANKTLSFMPTTQNQFSNQLIPLNNDTFRKEEFSSQQLLATHYKQKTMKEILEEDFVPMEYLRLMSESRLVESNCHTIVVCFPGIGCSYSIYHELAQTISEETNASVYSVCLPQRMEKISMDIAQFRLHEIIRAIRDEMIERQLVSLNPNQKLILYGHNMGGLIAYEIARSYQRMHYPVHGLIVDSMRSPFRQTMFNFSDDPHGIDDHTIVSHETHSNMHREHSQPSHEHLSMSPPPKPYYAQDFQPIRDATLLPTIASNFSSPATSVNMSRATKSPILSRANSSKLPPLSRNTSFKNGSSNHHMHGHGGLLGAALHHQSELNGRQNYHNDESHDMQHLLSRSNSRISAISNQDEDGNEEPTQYEQLMSDERELLPTILNFLPDKQLQTAIFKMGALPPILLQRRDLLRKILSVFRRDLELLGEYFVSPPIIPGIPYVEQISIDRNEAAELLEMPPSMFKLHFPVFSIHAELDPWIQNEEVTAWSLTSSSYEHFNLEEANHFHFQNENFVETLLRWINRLRAIDDTIE